MLLEYDLLSHNCSFEETIMQDCFDISIGKTPHEKNQNGLLQIKKISNGFQSQI